MILLEVLKGLADSVIATYEDNKPEIMIYGGAAGLVISGVLAAVAAYKSRPDVEELKECFEDVEYMEKEHRFPDKPERYNYFDEEFPAETYTKEDARKDKLRYSKVYGKRIILRWLLPVIIAVLSLLLIHGGVHEFQRINAELVEEVAKLTATVAACEDRLAKKLGKEEAVNAKYEKIDPVTGEEKFIAPEEGVQSDGTFLLKLTLQRCPDVFWNKDFDDRIALLKSAQQTLELYIRRQIEKYGACIVDSWEVMRSIGCIYGDDANWRNTHRDMRYVFKRDDIINIDFGLDEAQDLKDFGKAPKDEVWLHINFNEGVRKSSPRVVKG